MMRINGKFEGVEVAFEWDAGEFKALNEGGEIVTDLIADEAKIMEGLPIGPVGQRNYMDHINNALSVVFIAKRFLGHEFEISGNIPEADELPPGVIG